MSVINIFTKFSKMITFTCTTNTWTITAQYIKYFTYTKTVIHVCYQHCYQALQNYHLYMYNQQKAKNYLLKLLNWLNHSWIIIFWSITKFFDFHDEFITFLIKFKEWLKMLFIEITLLYMVCFVYQTLQS
jgi:hypothetical protein